MRVPRASYRLQFNSDFNFTQAEQVVPYLAGLGISDLYASPIFKARRASRHGYDVVDFNQLNPELGSDADFNNLINMLKKHNLGWIQDLVPNHMAYDGENQMLMEIFENGCRSAYFNFFDVDWNHQYENIRGRLLAPILGRRYGESLEDGEIKLGYDAEGFSINYYDKKFPLKIDTYSTIISHRLPVLRNRLGEDHIEFMKLLGILYIIKNLPVSKEEAFLGRYDQTKIIKNMLWEIYTKNAIIMHFLDENIALFNGEPGNPESFKLLDNLLADQIYRLSFWKVAAEELNYRRFFSINDLISLRMEEPEVFDHTHTLLFKMVEAGSITGLRIDHIDGLYDPLNYLQRLTQKLGDCYIIVEKILAFEEVLPPAWPVQGTTGYDFLNYCNGIFCDPKTETRFNRLYSKFIGIELLYEQLVYEKKKLIIERNMTGDVDNLAHLLKKVSTKYRHGRDISLYSFKRVIIELLSLFPVYRTYLNLSPNQEREYYYLNQTLQTAKNKNPDLASEFDFFEELLFRRSPEYHGEADEQELLNFIMRLQQYSGPLMAKGFEDTTLYIYNRLISLNEVGGEPQRWGIPPAKFHQYNQRKRQQWPYALNATATHDTKRGEDVRARINVLSEIPADWEQNLKKWSKLNQKKKPILGGKAIPDRNDEYLLYQTLIGTFPFDPAEYPGFRERIKQYMIKAVREAKVHTGWIKPDADYEAGLLAFIDQLLPESGQSQFLSEFLPFQKTIAYYGIFNSLSQTLLKITAPGIPDFYQGAELWDLNLVDPDNRRPVDFTLRQQILQEIKAKETGDNLALINELLASYEDGKLKLFLIYKALRARKQLEDLFKTGDYAPLLIKGTYKDHIVSFARTDKDSLAIIVVPRLLTSLITPGELPLGKKVWQDTVLLPPKITYPLTDVFTGRALENHHPLLIGDLLSSFPAALILGPPASQALGAD